MRARCSRARPTAISASPIPGRARCAPSMATTSASCRPISRPTRASTSPATAAAATRTAITGSPAASTTSSTFPATAWARRKSNSALVSHDKVSEAAVVGYPHDIKGQGIYCYVTLMAGESRVGRAAQGAGRPCPQGDRRHRLARQDPVRARPAEDPLRQDHAAHPAQDRRGRFRRARRHLDARRSGGRRRSHRQPAEQEGLIGPRFRSVRRVKRVGRGWLVGSTRSQASARPLRCRHGLERSCAVDAALLKADRTAGEIEQPEPRLGLARPRRSPRRTVPAAAPPTAGRCGHSARADSRHRRRGSRAPRDCRASCRSCRVRRPERCI